MMGLQLGRDVNVFHLSPHVAWSYYASQRRFSKLICTHYNPFISAAVCSTDWDRTTHAPACFCTLLGICNLSIFLSQFNMTVQQKQDKVAQAVIPLGIDGWVHVRVGLETLLTVIWLGVAA
jgi:hypothetical protein